MTRNLQQLIIFLLSFYFISCSKGEFDMENEKIRSLIEVESDSIPAAEYFRDGDVRTNLHAEFKEFYDNRDYGLAWLKFDRPKAQVEALLLALDAASEHGLRPDHYNIDKIKELLTLLYSVPGRKEKKENWQKVFRSKSFNKELQYQDTLRFKNIVKLDFLLTASYLVYGSHLLSGFIDPNENEEWFAPRRKKNLAKHLSNALNRNTVKASLEALAPSHEQYRLLQDYLKYLRELNYDVLPPVQTTLKKGDHGIEVLKAKKRLRFWKNIDPNMEDSLTYDANTVAAVKQFQQLNGLEKSGIINAEVLELLNKPSQFWVSKIETNMERLRWLQEDFGEKYLLVNIPAYQLKVINNKKAEMEMKVIVGTSYKKTPVFSDTLEYVVFNPTWTVPNSIAIEEMLPQIKRDPDYLPKRNLRLYDGWGRRAKELDPQEIDWEEIGPDNWHYRIIEEAGTANTLGQIKFMMPNNQAIYLHDTPSGHLFNEKDLTFSHGCIRVESPYKLAQLLLDWDKDQVLEYISSEETHDTPLGKKIPVHIVYWSAWVDEEGMINFRNDIYQHDKRQQERIKMKGEFLNE